MLEPEDVLRKININPEPEPVFDLSPTKPEILEPVQKSPSIKGEKLFWSALSQLAIAGNAIIHPIETTETITRRILALGRVGTIS